MILIENYFIYLSEKGPPTVPDVTFLKPTR